MPPSYGFSKSKRLLSEKAFSHVFQNARKVSVDNFMVLYRTNGLDYPRLGFALSKKKIRRAVDRNSLKRFGRESFRLVQAELPAVDIVFMAYEGAETLSKEAIWERLTTLWQKLAKVHAKY